MTVRVADGHAAVETELVAGRVGWPPLPQGVDPVAVTVLLIRTIEAFKMADLVILLTKGGNDTMTISYHVIRIANEQNKTSEGAAISYLMLFMVIVLTNLYLYFANRRSRGA